MSENKCISCIKDHLTGECYDIKDKVAREELATFKTAQNVVNTVHANDIKTLQTNVNNLKGGTQLYIFSLPFNHYVIYHEESGDAGLTIAGVVTFITPIKYISFSKTYSGKNYHANLPGTLYVLKVDGTIERGGDSCPVVGLSGDGLQYEKNGNIYNLPFSSQVYVDTGTDYVEDRLYLSLEEMNYTHNGTVYGVYGEPV